MIHAVSNDSIWDNESGPSKWIQEQRLRLAVTHCKCRIFVILKVKSCFLQVLWNAVILSCERSTSAGWNYYVQSLFPPSFVMSAISEVRRSSSRRRTVKTTYNRIKHLEVARLDVKWSVLWKSHLLHNTERRNTVARVSIRAFIAKELPLLYRAGQTSLLFEI